METPIKSSAKQNYQLDVQCQEKEQDLTSETKDSELQDGVDADKSDTLDADKLNTVDADLVLVDKGDDESEKYSELLKFSFCCLIAASIQIYLLDI